MKDIAQTVFRCAETTKKTSSANMCNVFHDQARVDANELSVKFDTTELSSRHILRNAIIYTSFLTSVTDDYCNF